MTLSKSEIVWNRCGGELIAQYESEPFVSDVTEYGSEVYKTAEVNVRLHGSDETGYCVTTDDHADGPDEAPATVYATRDEAIAAGVGFAVERGGVRA